MPVPIQILRVGEVGHHTVRADEPPDGGVVVAGVVVEQAEAVAALPGKVVVGGGGAAVPAFAAIGVEAGLVNRVAVAVGC